MMSFHQALDRVANTWLDYSCDAEVLCDRTSYTWSQKRPKTQKTIVVKNIMEIIGLSLKIQKDKDQFPPASRDDNLHW